MKQFMQAKPRLDEVCFQTLWSLFPRRKRFLILPIIRTVRYGARFTLPLFSDRLIIY